MGKKWYVFDMYDCFGGYATITEAAQQAQSMADENMQGIHIQHFTANEFVAYCESDAALKALRNKN